MGRIGIFFLTVEIITISTRAHGSFCGIVSKHKFNLFKLYTAIQVIYILSFNSLFLEINKLLNSLFNSLSNSLLKVYLISFNSLFHGICPCYLNYQIVILKLFIIFPYYILICICIVISALSFLIFFNICPLTFSW